MQRRTAQPPVVPVWLPHSILRRADARLHHIVTHVLKGPSYTSGIGFGEILELLLQCSLPSSSPRQIRVHPLMSCISQRH